MMILTKRVLIEYNLAGKYLTETENKYINVSRETFCEGVKTI